ncbi:MAG: hypothetical protein U0V70_16600 [Terriglobia bacterium]
MALLLLDLGAAKESGDQFRDYLRQKDADPEGYLGLGEAEFAQHDYQAADEAFRNALKLRPEDPALQKRFLECGQILALDPTLRGLSSAEKNRRSRLLLEEIVHAFEPCLQDMNTEAGSEIHGLMESAQKVLLAKPKQGEYGVDTEKNLALVESLWEKGGGRCRISLGTDDALSRAVAKLSAR